MYSNFITPPDFVNEEKHTVTLIDATVEEVELLGKIAQNSNEDYNIYLYRTEMNDPEWLEAAIKLSDSIIVNLDMFNNEAYCKNDKVYYYGSKTLLSPAIKISAIADYFSTRQNLNK